MKAKVKNNDGKPVLVKMRSLTPEETSEIALERAQIIVERLNLPSSAASKLAKALVTYSKKKEKTEKVSATTRHLFDPSYPRFSHGKYVLGCIHDVNSYVYTYVLVFLCVSLIHFQFRGASIKRKLLLYFRRG